MAIVHDVDLPDDLYEQLQELATAENNSINAQVITLLRNALLAKIKQPQDQRRQNVAKLLEESRRRRRVNPADFGLPDSTDLIREDRNR
ncbi:fumarate hydratase [Tolypothrix campylonemoides VB511288]|nr:fumarate hydratase [Tolypothrix campylonemoides VB511288]